MGEPGTWVELYHAALLEIDLEELADRIAEAEKAIQDRKLVLPRQADTSMELQALADALNNLKVLRKELPVQSLSVRSVPERSVPERSVPERSVPGGVSHIHPELKGDFVAVVNADRRYVAVTDGVCRLLGYSRAELLAKTIDEVTAPEMANDVPARFEEYVSQGFMEGEYLLVGRDRQRVAIRYEARTFPDGCLVARWEPVEERESLTS